MIGKRANCTTLIQFHSHSHSISLFWLQNRKSETVVNRRVLPHGGTLYPPLFNNANSSWINFFLRSNEAAAIFSSR